MPLERPDKRDVADDKSDEYDDKDDRDLHVQKLPTRIRQGDNPPRPCQEFATGRSPTTLSTVRTSMESMHSCVFGVYSARSGEFEYRSSVCSSS